MKFPLIFVRVVLVSCCSVYGARLGCIKSVRLNWRPWNRHVLPWGRYEKAVQTNNISRPPLPTSQARAGGSWQFKQVVVVDIAVVVVLVVVVVDLHLIHLLIRNRLPPVQLLQLWEQLVLYDPCCPGHLVGSAGLSGLASASTPEDFGFRLKSPTFGSIFLSGGWQPTDVANSDCLSTLSSFEMKR